MRKQLLALLSALGLAGSATPGTAQVVQGKDSSATTAAAQQKQNLPDKAVLIGLLLQSPDAKQKRRKAGGEQSARDLEDKHKRTAAEGLTLQGDAQLKEGKGTAESRAIEGAKQGKFKKINSENHAARNSKL